MRSRWEAWRSSAGKVTRTWNEWLAADGHDHERLYRGYLLALTEEERAAAALERAFCPNSRAEGQGEWLGPTAENPSERRDR